ncbi:hypothetical protein [Pseudomonas urmiensis]|uniref:Uncharacterized protein n=1 Tax=Pseudomonas urmiensis TaxID=2745493 RepID=A0A923JXI3_9PSED|nr:hypothetical protein [Pseudomonas urmiensis]MBV4537226.1 hypothetical protein [Pseudomonas urmiensis]
MFNMLVKSSPWNEGRDVFWKSRVFEYTNDDLRRLYTINDAPNFDALIKNPVIFIEETIRDRQQFGRVGRISRVNVNADDEITLEYHFDQLIPPIPQRDLIRLAPLLGMPSTRFGHYSRTHWAVKDIDIYHVILSETLRNQRVPAVFRLPPAQAVDTNLLSAMMPFAGFDNVWTAIQQVAEFSLMTAQRADSIWEHQEIIQDIVSLIDRSAVIIGDCSGRNANVFYEIGIAHALGKQVILITQNPEDIPFDLAHLRNIRYHNNGEGIERLKTELSGRLATIRNQALG